LLTSSPSSRAQVIENSGLEKMIVTNTIPQDDRAALTDKLEVLDISPVLAETIRRSHFGESVSCVTGHPPTILVDRSADDPSYLSSCRRYLFNEIPSMG
jgi:hypothetical protein